MNHDQKLIGHALRHLNQPEDRVQLMHLYIDGTLRHFRTKDRTWPSKGLTLEDLELMEFCGSATDFDVVANNRYRLRTAENNLHHQISSYTFHQSFTFTRGDGKLLSYMNPAYDPDSKSGFSCGREIVDSFYKACLYAGVNLESAECVVGSGKWSYSIGPLPNVELCDDVWLSRFILMRVAEDFGVTANFESNLPSNGRPPNTASIKLHTTDVAPDERLRIQDALMSQFIVKDSKHLKIQSVHHNIIISDLNADIDPYSLVTKVLEALNFER